MQFRSRSSTRRDLTRLTGSAGLNMLGLGAIAPLGRAAATMTLTLYSALHQRSVDMVTGAFTKASDIEVRGHHGEAPEIAAQIIREGARSPADVYFTENSPDWFCSPKRACCRRSAPRRSHRRRQSTAPRVATGSACWRARTSSRSTPE